MKINAFLIGARYLDFKTKEGNEIRGTQCFIVNSDIPNETDNRMPEKIFIKGKNLMDKLKDLNKYERDLLMPIECDCTLSGNKVIYNDINVVNP